MFTSGVLGLNVYLCPILSSDVPVCVFSEMSRVSWPNSCEYLCFEGPFLLFAFVSVDNILLAVRLQSTAVYHTTTKTVNMHNVLFYVLRIYGSMKDLEHYCSKLLLHFNSFLICVYFYFP